MAIDLKVRSKSDEEITEAKIRQVIWMLKAGKTKKACCEHLGINYNTKRLDKIIQDFRDNEEKQKSLQEKARAQPLTDALKMIIVKDYETGESVAALAKRYYLTSPRIKSILIEKNVPIRTRGNKSAKVDHVTQDLDAKFKVGDRIFIPAFNAFGKVKEVFDEEWIDFHKQGRQRYVELVDHSKIAPDTQLREDVHYNIYWELPNGKEWKLGPLKHMIQVYETIIEETGRESYRVWVEGEYSCFGFYKRKDLFPVVSQ